MTDTITVTADAAGLGEGEFPDLLLFGGCAWSLLTPEPIVMHQSLMVVYTSQAQLGTTLHILLEE